MFPEFSSSYQNKSKHALMIVPAQLPRRENRLAEFARFSGVRSLSPCVDAFATLGVCAACSCAAEQSEHPPHICGHVHFTDHGWACGAHHGLHAGHEEKPAQPVQVHFNVHVWLFEAHQLAHGAVVVVVVLEHGGHAAQSAQVHFHAHGLELGAHQLAQVVVGVVAGTVPVVVVHGDFDIDPDDLSNISYLAAFELTQAAPHSVSLKEVAPQNM